MTNSAVELIRPNADDVDYVIENLRESDKEELLASHGPGYEGRLRKAAQRGDSYVGRVHGEPIAILGVVPGSMIAGGGTPWLVGTDGIDQHKTIVARVSRRWVRDMNKKYGRLTNYVYHKHETAIAWLTWLGFALEDAKPYGVKNLPFHKFSMGE